MSAEPVLPVNLNGCAYLYDDGHKSEAIEILLVVKLPVRSSLWVGLCDVLTKQFGKNVFMRQQGQFMGFYKVLKEGE